MRKIITFLSLFWLTSCSVTKHLPAGESLYAGAEIKIMPDSLVNKKQALTVKNELALIVRPLPNNQLFGFPYKVWFYYLFGKPEKNKGLGAWFRKRFGEPPVLASKRNVSTNADLIANYLNNQGYFLSTADGKLVEKNREAKAIYNVHLKPQYTIDSVQFNVKDTTNFGRDILATQAKSLLKTGNSYDFGIIKAERSRIDAELKKKGFYLFSPDYLIILADTTVGKHRVNLTIEVKNTTSALAKKPYFIKNIYVFNNAKGDTIINDRAVRNFHLIDFGNTYRRRFFLDAIGFRSGALYSSDLQDISLSRLIYLNNFKFVKTRFDLLNRSDSALLNVNYFLTPLKKKTIQASVGGNSKSTGFLGTIFSLTWRNRNTFRGGEQLSLSANISYDWQIDGGDIAGLSNVYRWFLQGNLLIPRFLFPFVRINAVKNQSLPQTNIDVRYENIIKKDLYTQTSLSLLMGYDWRQSASIKHSLRPIAISVVKPSNINNERLTDLIFRSNNPAELLKILSDRLILGATYNFTYAPPQKSKHLILFNGGIDIAGNLAGLIAKKAITESDPRQIFGINYEQYARFDADFRYFLNINPKIRWANRFVLGLGIPYGNSNSLPDFKQFFSGGTSSIRAFSARSLGPGSYRDTTSGKLISNGGDMKLELNTELRAKITPSINGAIFVDAGNVWMYRDPSIYDERAVFSKNFYKEIAVGSGVGLRLDFTYVIFRLDVAMPLRKPWLPEADRWVFKQIDFSNPTWRSENLVFNLAVGYPF